MNALISHCALNSHTSLQSLKNKNQLICKEALTHTERHDFPPYFSNNNKMQSPCYNIIVITYEKNATTTIVTITIAHPNKRTCNEQKRRQHQQFQQQ